MTTIIEKYKPSKNELIKIKELSKDCPKLLEIFEEAEYRLDRSSIEFTGFQHRLANETVAGNQY